MANKERALVEIELNDKMRKIRYTLNSLAELEDKLGVSLDELNTLKMGIKQLRAFLWAGLIHEDENLTEKEVGEWVDLDNMTYINEKVTEAFKAGSGKN
jgi:regulator of replication initiation timing